MKGISTIIATILMLMITIALAGTAYLFISGSLTQNIQGIEVVDEFCQSGTTAVLTFRNAGTNAVTYVNGACADGGVALATCGSLNIRRTSPSADFAAGQPTGNSASIDPGTTATLSDTSCTTAGNARTCVYRITPPSGRSVTATVGCTG